MSQKKKVRKNMSQVDIVRMKYRAESCWAGPIVIKDVDMYFKAYEGGDFRKHPISGRYSASEIFNSKINKKLVKKIKLFGIKEKNEKV